MTEHKERPILFSAPMVRVILSEQKTQTRRTAKTGSVKAEGGVLSLEWLKVPHSKEILLLERNGGPATARSTPLEIAAACPYGQPGDRLIVKENAWVWYRKERDGDTKTGRPKFNYIPMGRFVHYQADEQRPTYRVNESTDQGWRLKIGRYPPRWASRITLEVTGVRVERLQSISEEDAKSEGVPPLMGTEVAGHHVTTSIVDGGKYRDGFRAIWGQINGAASWDANPWVWAIEFRKVANERR